MPDNHQRIHAAAKYFETLFRHPDPLALVIRVIGETFALVQGYFLWILNAHVVRIDASLDIRAVIRRPVALVKDRKFTHRWMHLHELCMKRSGSIDEMKKHCLLPSMA
jgi:hypothetical protein